jgi:hypothetical protein
VCLGSALVRDDSVDTAEIALFRSSQGFLETSQGYSLARATEARLG